ncbi:sulfotransferase [Streptosporangium sp. NPDC051023]|uniref:sulfotransferase family protein n=1 Tax=Streptosporangium sp. NPDC051023 TaxID=3155410 RepID=UPI00344BCD10
MTSTESLPQPAHPALTPPKPFPPPPLTPGWEPGPPDFVGIGAMRSGTTWWWSVLRSHPGVAPADAADGPHAGAYTGKELHFFDHYGQVEDVDPAAYHRYFPRPPGSLVGEWTPRYMYDFWTPPMLRQAAPDARILVMLRDPVERFVSGVARYSTRGFAVDPALYHDQFSRGLYWRQLIGVLGYFPRDRVLVLQYERCVRDFAGQARRTFAFLGLDPERWTPPTRPETPVGIVTRGAEVVNAATLEAIRQAYRGDLDRLFTDFPDLDRALWPSASG